MLCCPAQRRPCVCACRCARLIQGSYAHCSFVFVFGFGKYRANAVWTLSTMRLCLLSRWVFLLFFFASEFINILREAGFFLFVFVFFRFHCLWIAHLSSPDASCPWVSPRCAGPGARVASGRRALAPSSSACARVWASPAGQRRNPESDPGWSPRTDAGLERKHSHCHVATKTMWEFKGQFSKQNIFFMVYLYIHT